MAVGAQQRERRCVSGGEVPMMMKRIILPPAIAEGAHFEETVVRRLEAEGQPLKQVSKSEQRRKYLLGDWPPYRAPKRIPGS